MKSSNIVKRCIVGIALRLFQWIEPVIAYEVRRVIESEQLAWHCVRQQREASPAFAGSIQLPVEQDGGCFGVRATVAIHAQHAVRPNYLRPRGWANETHGRLRGCATEHRRVPGLAMIPPIGSVVAIERTHADNPDSGVYQVDPVKRKLRTPRKLQAFVFGEAGALTPTDQEPKYFLIVDGWSLR